MLMFISFPAIIFQWIALDSLASSLRTDAFSDASTYKYSKTGRGCQAYFQGNCPGFAKSSVFGTMF